MRIKKCSLLCDYGSLLPRKLYAHFWSSISRIMRIAGIYDHTVRSNGYIIFDRHPPLTDDADSLLNIDPIAHLERRLPSQILAFNILDAREIPDLRIACNGREFHTCNQHRLE